MMLRYWMATYFFDAEYPSGAGFLLALDVLLVLVFSQVAVFAGCAASFALSESYRTIAPAASFVLEKLTLALVVFLFLFFL